MIDLSDKVIWITGGTKGIGFETAKLLSETNAKIYVSGRSEINLGDFNNISFLKCDVTDFKQIAHAITWIITRQGKLDILINNAGIFNSNSIKDISLDEFDSIFNVNVKGAFFVLKAAALVMAKKKSGLVININSVATKTIFPGTSMYSATKSALDSITKVAREEFREDNIMISNIYPGATETDIWDDDFREAHADEMMKPEDVANAILKLIELNYENNLVPEELVIRPKGGDL